MAAFWSSILKCLRGRSKPVVETVTAAERRKALEWGRKYYSEERKQKIAARFVTILEMCICVPIKQFSPQTIFRDDLTMDELEPVEVLIAIEEEFETGQISEKDAAEMRTIDDAIRYLAARVEPKDESIKRSV